MNHPTDSGSGDCSLECGRMNKCKHISVCCFGGAIPDANVHSIMSGALAYHAFFTPCALKGSQ